jgi:serine/threonine protein kinase
MGAYSCALGDVWSVAITIFNMVTGHPPWKCAHPRCDDDACHGFIVHALYPSANHHRYRFPISTDMHRLWRDAVVLEPSARLNLREFRARFVHARELFPSEEQIREQIALKPHTEDRMARMIEQLFACADEFAAYEDELDAAEAFEAAVLAASPELLQTPRVRDTVLLLDTSAPDDVPDDCFTIGSDSDTSPVSISSSSAPTASDSDDPGTPASAIVPVVLNAAEVSILELSAPLASTDLVASTPDGKVRSETLAPSAKASGDFVAAAIYRPGFGPASVRRARVDLLLR